MVIVQVWERTPRGGIREWWARADRDVYYRRRADAVRGRGRGAKTGPALAAGRYGRGRTFHWPGEAVVRV